MARENRERNNKAERAVHSQIARAVFAAAESMGLSDREFIEQLA